MPPARRRKAAAQKEETVTTTEVIDQGDTDDEPTETAEESQRREKVSPDAALFLRGFVSKPPPAHLKGRDYVRAEGYDDVMDQMWKRYCDAGKPHWSRSGDLTRADRPEGGWWSEREDIWTSAIVPDAEDARALVRRAANRIGCSYRFNSEEIEHDGERAFEIYFTVAPVLGKNRTKTTGAKTAETDDNGDNETTDG